MRITKAKRYKVNKRKILRNIIIITLLVLITLYIKLISNFTNELLNNYDNFTSYAKENNIIINAENYQAFMQNKQ